MYFAAQLQPSTAVALVRTYHRASRFPENLRAAARARIKPCLDELRNHFLVIDLVKMSKVIELHHREGLQVKAGIFALERGQKIREVAEGEFCIQTARDMEFSSSFCDSLA